MAIYFKKRLLSNLLFIVIFSALFALYCKTATYVLERVNSSEKSAQADAAHPTRLIVIDPGHGGEDGGAVGVSGVYEKDLNLDISEKLGTFLRFSGFEVVHTRTEDIMLYDRNIDYKGRKKVLDLAARLKIAQEVMPDLFVSLHMNSFPDNRYSGLTVYYSPNHPRSYDAAVKIRTDVINMLQPDNNRELKRSGSNIYLLNRITCPAVLIECGFLSNAEECENLSNRLFRQRLTLVFYNSISSFFED